MNKHDFLVELLTEELPAKSLRALALSLQAGIEKALQSVQLTYHSSQYFATPRRLAVLVTALAEEQPMQTLTQRGPRLSQAYDADGNPTPAGLKFAESCGVALEALTTLTTDKGQFLYLEQEKCGEKTMDLLPMLITQTLAELSLSKSMRWGSAPYAFVRPVHGVVALFGEAVVPVTCFGIASDRITQGHRFLCPDSLVLGFPHAYETQLEDQGCVIPCFEKRQQTIEQALRQAHSGVMIDPALLEEVTGLVEWPEVLMGTFDPTFLTVPKEALMSSMQHHQKCFPIQDEKGQLLPLFLTVSNMPDQPSIICGNERVMRARLSDAAFFFEQDKQTPLAARISALNTVMYQEKLGSLFDKVQRVEKIAQTVGSDLGFDTQTISRAVSLCKADLRTQMVSEFPELQGVMGEYYALHDGESAEIAHAIREHYLPRFADDLLPVSHLGALLGVADRLDTLSSMFSIGLLPTGDKDPFALKRAASSVLKLLWHFNWDLSLAGCERQLLAFFRERLKTIALEQGISVSVFQTVTDIVKPVDALRRMHAVQQFMALPESAALASANKRVSQLLKKQSSTVTGEVNPTLFEKPVEQRLWEQIEHIRHITQGLAYAEVLTVLTQLKPVVDEFFAEVMVMTEEPALRTNRLLLLQALRGLFLQVADIAEWS